MNPPQQSIHFEMMYSKSKDICAVGSIGNHSLHALMHHMSAEIVGKDDVLLTGSFLPPVLLGPGACMNAISAVACLRKLSLPNQGKAQIRFFSTYFPSVINFLELKYGSTEVQSLFIPSSGAVQFHLTLKN